MCVCCVPLEIAEVGLLCVGPQCSSMLLQQVQQPFTFDARDQARQEVKMAVIQAAKDPNRFQVGVMLWARSVCEVCVVCHWMMQ